MPTQSPGDGGGDGGGGSSSFGGGVAAGGGLSDGRNVRVIKIPGGQDQPIHSLSVGSRSAPCPGCTLGPEDINPCIGAECKYEGGGDEPADKYLLHGGFFRRWLGRGPGAGGEPGRGSSFVSIGPPPPPPSPPPPPIDPGHPPGDPGEPGPGPGGGLGSIQLGRPPAGGYSGGGFDLNDLLERLLVRYPFLRNEPGAITTSTQNLRGYPQPSGVPGPQGRPAIARTRYILKKVPGSFELPLEEERLRRRRRRVYR